MTCQQVVWASVCFFFRYNFFLPGATTTSILETPSSTTYIHRVNTQIGPNDVLTRRLGLKVCFFCFFFFRYYNNFFCQVPPLPPSLKCHLRPLISTASTPK